MMYSYSFKLHTIKPQCLFTAQCCRAVVDRKAVKAAIVLLPLLGVNNSLALVRTPTDTAVKFAVFTTVCVFLVSFQGFFIALIYCFLNGEVQSTLRRRCWDPYTSRSAMSDSLSQQVS